MVGSCIDLGPAIYGDSNNPRASSVPPRPNSPLGLANPVNKLSQVLIPGSRTTISANGVFAGQLFDTLRIGQMQDLAQAKSKVSIEK